MKGEELLWTCPKQGMVAVTIVVVKIWFTQYLEEGDIGGFWTPQYRKIIDKYRNTSNTLSKIDTIPKLLLCSLNFAQISA